MKRLGLVFLLIFCSFGASVVEGETCWESIPLVDSVVVKYELKLSEFKNKSIAAINEVVASASLNNIQKHDAITNILIHKRKEVLVIKWAGINELQAIFHPTEGEIFFNGLKKFLGLTRSPTLYPFRCFVKEAKYLAIKSFDTYKAIALRGIHMNKKYD